ncbi:HYR domain-containing protein [Aliiroseovarius sp. PrR006]|uniref:HYR domain-containing protein n=1 Tax=Aliiroseovarius sp. PrR006 TaxID=2706883 RepID=UPI0013D530BE|nr:HYR domain-containing protein [Aliiroseovarius sp. PrR006]NDW53878.1 HYR domain-containing protein [Aliiroseovarius sp. PrR006]
MANNYENKFRQLARAVYRSLIGHQQACWSCFRGLYSKIIEGMIVRHTSVKRNSTSAEPYFIDDLHSFFTRLFGRRMVTNKPLSERRSEEICQRNNLCHKSKRGQSARRPKFIVGSWTKAFAIAACTLGFVGAAQAQEVTSASVSPTTYSGSGETLTFTINANTGNEVLSSPAVSSSIGVSYTCSPTSGGTNSNFTCSGTYTTQAGDATTGAGVYENATVTNRGGLTQMLIGGGNPTMSATYVAPSPPSDTTPPTITNMPANITQSTDPGVAAAVVSWTAPTYSDNVGVTSSGCFPSSGSTFSLGTTTVTCSASDAAGNTTSESFSVTVNDNEAPVVTVPADITVNTDPGQATAVVNFTPIATDNVGVTSLVSTPASGSVFPVGTTTVSVTATDAAGNTDTKTFTVTVNDGEAPVFTSSQADINVEISFNLTSAVVNFPTPTASDNSGTVTVTQTQGPTSGSAFPVGTTLVEFTATDPAGLTTTLQFNVTVSLIPPGTVTFIVNSPDDGTITFSSATPAFNTPVVVSGGTGSSGPLQVEPGTYAATYALPAGFVVTSASCSSGSGTVNVGAQSLALNFARGETYTCTLESFDIATPTATQIQNFMDNRGRQIMGNRPGQDRRIARVDGNASPNRVSLFGNDVTRGSSLVGVDVTRDRVDLSFASTSASEDPLSARSDWDVWAELSFTRYETSFSEGRFGVLHVGADYRIGQNAILGFGAQVDSVKEDVLGSTATTKGVGWMVGPYYTAQIDEGLYFDASLSYGRASNEVSPLGTFSDEFDSERWLGSISLFGSINQGNLNIQPNVSINYFEETSEAYVDSLAIPIAARTTRLGDIELGSRFTWSDPMGDFSNYLEFEGVYTFEAGDQIASTSTVQSGVRGRIGFGGMVMVSDQGTIEYGVRYDGIGDSDYEALSLNIGYSRQF